MANGDNIDPLYLSGLLHGTPGSMQNIPGASGQEQPTNLPNARRTIGQGATDAISQMTTINRAWGALGIPPGQGAPEIDPSLLPRTQLPSVTVQDLSALLKGGPAIPQSVPQVGQNLPQNPDLANARGRIAQELQDPAVRQKLMASIQAEVGNQGSAAKLGYVESVMNRAIARQTTLNQTISDTSYYPDSTISKLGQQVPDKTQAELNAHIQNALAGSNLTNFATGNESGNVRSGNAPITFNPGTGERFVLENADKGWQQSIGRVAQVGASAQAAQPQGMTVADLLRQHGL